MPRSALSFYSESANKGISFPYPHITLHAISRDAPPPASSANGGEPSTTTTACIYCQIEESEGELEDTEGMEESGTREMWITPSDPESGEFLETRRFSSLSLPFLALFHSPTRK